MIFPWTKKFEFIDATEIFNIFCNNNRFVKWSSTINVFIAFSFRGAQQFLLHRLLQQVELRFQHGSTVFSSVELSSFARFLYFEGGLAKGLATDIGRGAFDSVRLTFAGGRITRFKEIP